MKVKFFAACNALDLEQAVNDFIQDKLVIDIKFVSLHIKNVGINDRVIVLYEDAESGVIES